MVYTQVIEVKKGYMEARRRGEAGRGGEEGRGGREGEERRGEEGGERRGEERIREERTNADERSHKNNNNKKKEIKR